MNYASKQKLFLIFTVTHNTDEKKTANQTEI